MLLTLSRRLVRVILIPGLATLLGLLLLPGANHPVLSQAQPQTQNTAAPVPVPAFLDTPMGAVESYYRPDDAVEAGVGFERIIFEWRYLQPNGPDDWDTSHVPDEWLLNAQKGQRMVIGLLKNAPEWATGSKLLGANPKGLELPLDDPHNYWAAFVKKMVLYYGPKWNIHHWIIYNEPDIRPENTPFFEFSGTVRDYYQVVKVAYKAAHANDWQAVIHLAGLTFWQDIQYNRNYYLDRFIRTAYADPEGRKNGLFFDVLSVHTFQNTDAVWYITKLFQHLPQTVGFTKPVWVDEMNALINDDGNWPISSGYAHVSLAQQASYIIQGSALALAAGAERVQVYRLFDDEVHAGYEAWGVIRADGTRRASYYALKTASEFFRNTTTIQRYKNNFATVIVFVQPERTVYVIWNRTLREPIYVHLPVAPESDYETPLRLVTQTGLEHTLTLADPNALLPADRVVNGQYELLLSPCDTSCEIQGEPRIVVQAGGPRVPTILSDKGQMVPFTINDTGQPDQPDQP